MGLSEALLSLTGLCIGDAFGASLNSAELSIEQEGLPEPAENPYLKDHTLPPAPWRWTAETQIALSVVEELEQREWIDQDRLAHRMAWRYTADPTRGFGPGTRQVLERIAQGEYFRSVTRAAYEGGSFGSLASSRAIPIGGFFHRQPELAIRDVRLASTITHLHPEGQAGAEAVAIAAVLAADENPPRGVDFLGEVVDRLPDSLVRSGIHKAMAIPAGQVGLASRLLGVGDRFTVIDTVPFSLWCAAHYLDNFEEALWITAQGGGKRNTNCAIVGGLLALAARGFPRAWQARCESLPRRINLDQKAEPGRTGSLGTGGLPSGPRTSLPNLGKEPQPVSIRQDPLTGLPNLLGLLDWMKQQSDQERMAPFYLVVVHMIGLWDVNRSQGRTAGDDLLRSSARTLQAFAPGLVFRPGGDKFAIILRDNSIQHGSALSQAQAIAQSVHVPTIRHPNTALIHFSDAKFATPGYLLASLYAALGERNFTGQDGIPRMFDSTEMHTASDFPWLMVDLAEQMLRMSGTADESIRLALTDSVSQLPNMRAAVNNLDAAVNRARSFHAPLAILLVDGDNLRLYNQISYNAGDEAIRLLGHTLRSQLRETDFIARWRTGDEFLILLANTNRDAALLVGQRLCRAVEISSKNWLLPSTISVGIAIYPEHGLTVQTLLEVAEQSLETAKQNGKNRVFLAEASLYLG